MEDRRLYEDETSETYSAYFGAEITPNEPTWFEELDTQVYWRYTEVVEDTNRLMYQTDQNGVLVRRRDIDHKTFTDQTLGYRADFLHTMYTGNAEHKLAYGLDFSTDYYERVSDETVVDWNGVKPEDKEPFAPARAYRLGLYFRDMVELGKWTITGGIRFDAHSLTPDSQNGSRFCCKRHG